MCIRQLLFVVVHMSAVLFLCAYVICYLCVHMVVVMFCVCICQMFSCVVHMSELVFFVFFCAAASCFFFFFFLFAYVRYSCCCVHMTDVRALSLHRLADLCFVYMPAIMCVCAYVSCFFFCASSRC